MQGNCNDMIHGSQAHFILRYKLKHMISKITFELYILFTILLAAVLNYAPIPAPITFLLGCALTSIYFFLRKRLTHQVSKNLSKSTSIDDANHQTLYVGNLPYKANDDDIRQLFSKYATVISVRLIRDKRTGKRKGFGFVVIEKKNTQKVLDAINNYEFMQRALKVRKANDPKFSKEEE